MIQLLKRLIKLAEARNLLLALELIAIPLSIYAIIQSSIAIHLQQDSNNFQKIALAWSQLSTPAPGNSGKGGAINLLYSEGESLTGILLDCESMGGSYVEDPEFRCKGSPYIKGLKLIGGRLPDNNVIIGQRANSYDPDDCHAGSLEIKDSNFSGSTLEEGKIYCAMIIDVDIKYTTFDNFSIENSWLYNVDISNSFGLKLIENRIEGMVAVNSKFIQTDFGGMHAIGINFTGAKFDGVNFKGLVAADLNVSGTDFCYFHNEAFPATEENCPDTIPDDVLAAMWAWSDMPPKGIGPISERLKEIKLCPAELREYSFGTAREYYGFVYDRGYKAPELCFPDIETQKQPR